MKKLLFSLLAIAFVTFATAQEGKKPTDVAKLNSETIDLGKIKVGNPQAAKFVVTNISGEPLIIETASPTCGCTISDYTKAPIEPGKTGFINATYNAANVGTFTKTLSVKFAGVNEVMSIKITGEVLSAEDYDKGGNPSIVKAEVVAPVKVAVPAKTAVKPATKTTKIKTATKVTAPATK